MKRMLGMSALFVLSVAGEAIADCNSTRVTDLATLLQGNTVCVGGGGNWDAQEYHSGASGQPNNLIDWHHGPRDPAKGKKELPNTDPTDPVGMWTINNNAQPNATVTYDYGAGAIYTNTVHDNGNGTYSFCHGATETIATIIDGQVPCGGP